MGLNDDVWNMEPSWSRSTPQSRYGGMGVIPAIVVGSMAAGGVFDKKKKTGRTIMPTTSQKQNNELPAKASALKATINMIQSSIRSIESAGSQYQGMLAGTEEEGVLTSAVAALSDLQALLEQAQATLPAVSQNYGSFQGSTDAWTQADAAEQEAKQAVAEYSGLPGQITSAAAKVQKARNAAATQQQNDTAVVNGALTNANGLMTQGNYQSALNAIQTQSVVDAAARLGRSGELANAAGQIGFEQKKQTDAQARIDKAREDERNALLQAKGDCEARQGRWTGTSCDMSVIDARIRAEAAQSSAASADAQRAAASAKVDTAIQQANARAASSDFRGALLILSGATAFANQADRALDVQMAMADVQSLQDAAQQEKARGQIQARVQAAVRQANTYAAGGSFDIALNVLNSVLSDASQAGLLDDVSNAQLTIQNMKRDAQASQAAGLAPGQALQQNRQAAEQCFDRGGEWDPTSLYCNMRPVREREQAERDRQAAERAEQAKLDRLMALQPLASGNAALQAQILAAILGQSGVTVDPSALTPQAPTMATSVPGDGWSPPPKSTFSSSPMFAPSGGYVDFGGGGRESF